MGEHPQLDDMPIEPASAERRVPYQDLFLRLPQASPAKLAPGLPRVLQQSLALLYQKGLAILAANHPDSLAPEQSGILPVHNASERVVNEQP